MAVDNLHREAVDGQVALVGDVMIDVARRVQPLARERIDLLQAHGLVAGEYVLATAHRAGNVDDPARLALLVALLLAVPLPVILPLHPRTKARLRDADLLDRLERSEHVILTAPVGYVELTALLCNARAVLTDSGGIQKEAYLAGVPCITMRPSTEWVETVDNGWNVLVDLDRDAALAALDSRPTAERPDLYGDGAAGARVLQALTAYCENGRG
jgi:UDP-N-acetylglucosamine 2-epimerase (non-hydrolysing)/UDP-GlcNAc3NAcA epimerase